MNIQDLNGAVLDFWVGVAQLWIEDQTPFRIRFSNRGCTRELPAHLNVFGNDYRETWEPHRNWATAGPIIEQAGIAIYREYAADAWVWCAAAPIHGKQASTDRVKQKGSSLLVAAMRAYVASAFPDGLAHEDAQYAAKRYEIS